MNLLTSRLDSLFAWVLQASWQAAVLAALVLAAQLIFRNRLSPSWRYGLWMLVVVRLLMPLSPQSALSIFNLTKLTALQPAAPPAGTPPGRTERSLVSEGPASAPLTMRRTLPALAEDRVPGAGSPSVALKAGAPLTRRTELMSPTNWFGPAAAVWLAGACLLGLRLWWANSVFRSRLARHTPLSDQRTMRLLRECAQVLGVAQRVTALETEAVRGPAVCGLWRKWLLLPDGVFERFSDGELRHVLMHEFAHLRRRDLEINWLVTLLQSLHWFNPVLWLAFARLRVDRELATDALALAHAREADNVPYGETILKVLEGSARTAVQPGLVGIAENQARLRERLREIARRGTARPWRWAAIALAAVITGVGLTDARQSKPANANAGRTAASNSLRARRIAGNVVDAETKEPIQEFQVIVGHVAFGTGDPAEDVFWERNRPFLASGGRYSFSAEPPLFQPDGLGPSTRLLVEAKGYLPRVSPELTSSGWSSTRAPYDFQLKRGDGPRGVVRLPDGHPAAGVTVALAIRVEGGSLWLKGSRLEPRGSGNVTAVSDAEGKFALPAAYASRLLAASSQGYAEAPLERLDTNLDLTLRPWGRIEGVIRNGHSPATNQWVSVVTDQRTPGRSLQYDFDTYRAQTDEQGRFVLTNVPPGERQLFRLYPLDRQGHRLWGPSPLQTITVESGETTRVDFGGSGRTIIGKVVPNEERAINWQSGLLNWQEAFHTLGPRRGAFDSPEEREARARYRSYFVQFADDGSFRIEAVLPGKYVLSLIFNEPGTAAPFNARPVRVSSKAILGGVRREVEVAPAGSPRRHRDLGILGGVSREVEVAPLPDGQPDRPLDLGRLDLVVHHQR
jgi:beta-lactamase regulating signal transducer with metallopeptidase domain